VPREGRGRSASHSPNRLQGSQQTPPADIPQEVVGSSRRSPAIPANHRDRSPAHAGNPRPARNYQDRHVTPEVAGSSPVAPVKIPANLHLLLLDQAQSTAGSSGSRAHPAPEIRGDTRLEPRIPARETTGRENRRSLLGSGPGRRISRSVSARSRGGRERAPGVPGDLEDDERDRRPISGPGISRPSATTAARTTTPRLMKASTRAWLPSAIRAGLSRRAAGAQAHAGGDLIARSCRSCHSASLSQARLTCPGRCRPGRSFRRSLKKVDSVLAHLS
jgi:hypothetical protein